MLSSPEARREKFNNSQGDLDSKEQSQGLNPHGSDFTACFLNPNHCILLFKDNQIHVLS